MKRRFFLLSLALAPFAAAGLIARRESRIVIRDGWILLEDDLA